MLEKLKLGIARIIEMKMEKSKENIAKIFQETIEALEKRDDFIKTKYGVAYVGKVKIRNSKDYREK